MQRIHLRGISLAWALCGIQALISVIVAGVVAVGLNKAAAFAALFGGMIAIVPNLYMARKVYARRDGDEPKVMLGRFYSAEIGKYALTAMLFFVGVSLFVEQFLPLICTYIACLMAYWVVMAVARID